MSPQESQAAILRHLQIDHTDRLQLENATLREALENERKFSAASRAAHSELVTRIAALEAEAKQAESDTGWALSHGAIVHRDDGFWYAVAENECGSDTNLFAALRDLRAQVEGGAK
jgi:hypothetical protein